MRVFPAYSLTKRSLLVEIGRIKCRDRRHEEVSSNAIQPYNATAIRDHPNCPVGDPTALLPRSP